MPIIVVLYTLYGLLFNYLHMYFEAIDSGTGKSVLFSIHILLMLALIGFVVLTLAKYNWSPADWGFTLDKGVLVSLGLIGLVVLMYMTDAGLFVFRNWAGDYLQFVSLTFEELIFRVLLINYLVLIFGSFKGQFFLVVLLSALIFTVPHIPKYSLFELANGTFQIGLLFAIVYYLTGSVLFPIFCHVMLNRVDQFGFMGAIMVLVMYLALAGLELYRAKYVSPKGVSADTEIETGDTP